MHHSLLENADYCLKEKLNYHHHHRCPYQWLTLKMGNTLGPYIAVTGVTNKIIFSFVLWPGIVNMLIVMYCFETYQPELSHSAPLNDAVSHIKDNYGFLRCEVASRHGNTPSSNKTPNYIFSLFFTLDI